MRCDTQTMEAALASARAIGGGPVALKARHNILLVMPSACSKRTAQEGFGGLRIENPSPFPNSGPSFGSSRERGSFEKGVPPFQKYLCFRLETEENCDGMLWDESEASGHRKVPSDRDFLLSQNYCGGCMWTNCISNIYSHHCPF